MIIPSTSSIETVIDGELHRRDDGVAEDGVVEEVAVVLEPDELRRLEPAEELRGS